MGPRILWLCVLLGSGVASARGADAPAEPPAPAAARPAAPAWKQSTLELQVQLHLHGFSCGSIDGVWGAQTSAAVRAFQRATGIAETGVADAPTLERLAVNQPLVAEHTVSEAELEALRPAPTSWVEKSQADRLAYTTPLEMVAELYHAHPNLLKRLNPGIDWTAVTAGTTVVVPAADRPVIDGTAAQIIVSLGARELEVLDDTSRVIAHFPVSIAHIAEKRPVGELHVVVIIVDPDYTFDPAVFPESPEARTLGHKLIIPPGPNNPVGRAWIGLDRPGYGIHGTPDPEKVGRTESHGCFRLANWDALTLVRLARVGMSVLVEP